MVVKTENTETIIYQTYEKRNKQYQKYKYEVKLQSGSDEDWKNPLKEALKNSVLGNYREEIDK